MKNVNKNDNIKRSSMHLNQGYFLSKQWGEAQIAFQFLIKNFKRLIRKRKAIQLKVKKDRSNYWFNKEEVLRKCGLMDPRYRNALEHVDHTYRIIREGFHPLFRWFADLAESSRFIDDLDPYLSKSTMQKKRLYSKFLFNINFLINNIYFFYKYGRLVQNIADVGEREVGRVLTDLKRQHGYHDIR